MRTKITFLLLIILMFISPPFIFSEALYFGREIRAFLIITIILLLFLQIRKFRFIDIFIFILIGIFIFLNIFFSESLLNNIFSFFSIILVAFLLFILLRSNKLNCNIFLNFWLYFSFILSVAAITSFLVNQFTNLNFDILNFKAILFLNSNYDYKVNIFGVTLSKNFYFINVERVCSFFNEPQYAGFFFILNILLIKVNRNLISKKFLVTQILAGMLTFSLTFYITFAILLISFLKRYVIYFLAILLFFILSFLIITNSIDVINDLIYDYTSLQVRLIRSYNFYKTLEYFSPFNIFFGNNSNNYHPNEMSAKFSECYLEYILGISENPEKYNYDGFKIYKQHFEKLIHSLYAK
jgi:hypothetical protein